VQSLVDCSSRLDFGGAVADFCSAGFYPVVQDEGPPPARVNVDGLLNLVGNAPMSHRTAFSKMAGDPRDI
jgi:hypothetical protein